MLALSRGIRLDANMTDYTPHIIKTPRVVANQREFPFVLRDTHQIYCAVDGIDRIVDRFDLTVEGNFQAKLRRNPFVARQIQAAGASNLRTAAPLCSAMA